MPRAKRPTPFAHREVIGLCKRFVKPETYDARRDIILFYRVYSLWPDEAFWRAYHPGFPLNSIAYFLTEEGKTKVTTDLAVFHLDLTPHQSYPELGTKVGEDLPAARPKRTVKDLLG